METPAAKPAPPWAMSALIVITGLGMGMIIYRLTALGFLLQGPRASILQFVGIGLVAGASVAARKLAGGAKQSFKWHAALALLVGALAGIGVSVLVAPPLGRTPLSTRALPGLSIDMPAGKWVDKGTSYATGQVLVDGAGGFNAVTGVSWSMGAPSTEAELRDILGVTAKVMGSTAGSDPVQGFAMPAGLTAVTVALVAKDKPGWLSMFNCGKRQFTVVTLADYQGAKRLHQRMLASVVCKPDPAQENLEPEGPKVALDLPEGWTKSDSDSSQTTYTNGETHILIVLKLPEAEIDMIKFITATFASQGMKLAMAPLPAEGGRALWSLTIDDTPAGRGFVARWSCPWGPVAGFYVDAEGGDPAPGKALLLGARCN